MIEADPMGPGFLIFFHDDEFTGIKTKTNKYREDDEIIMKVIEEFLEYEG